MKKLCPTVSLLIMIVILLTACGGQTKVGEEKVLRVWTTMGDDPAVIQAMFDQFTAISGYRIEVTTTIEDDKILPALTASEPPDILIVGDGALAKAYANEGLVDDLSSAIEANAIDLTDFYPGPLMQCQEGDKYYCLPWGSDLYALFWNKDLFEAAGLDPERPPLTMEELVAYADQLTIVNPDGSLEQIGFIPDLSWSHSDLYVRMFGGFWYSDDGTQLTINSQPVIDALLWQQQFYSKYGYDNVLEFWSGFGEYNSPDHPFFAGKVAMMVEGEWIAGPSYIPTFKPELNYGVVAFPPPADHPERAGTVVAQGTVVVIPSGATNKEASGQLLAWMMTPGVIADQMCRNGNLPTTISSTDEPCFNINLQFNTFVELMASPNAVALISTPYSAEINNDLSLVEEKVLHTGADPILLLNEIQAEYEDNFK